MENMIFSSCDMQTLKSQDKKTYSLSAAKAKGSPLISLRTMSYLTQCITKFLLQEDIIILINVPLNMTAAHLLFKRKHKIKLTLNFCYFSLYKFVRTLLPFVDTLISEKGQPCGSQLLKTNSIPKGVSSLRAMNNLMQWPPNPPFPG